MRWEDVEGFVYLERGKGGKERKGEKWKVEREKKK